MWIFRQKNENRNKGKSTDHGGRTPGWVFNVGNDL